MPCVFGGLRKIAVITALVVIALPPASVIAAECVEIVPEGVKGAPAPVRRPAPELVLSQVAVQVFDEVAEPLPGTDVVLTTNAREFAIAKTSARGYVTFPAIPPGKYELDVHLAGFASLHRDVRVVSRDAAPPGLLAVMLLVSQECAVPSRVCIVPGPATPQSSVPRCLKTLNP